MAVLLRLKKKSGRKVAKAKEKTKRNRTKKFIHMLTLLDSVINFSTASLKTI